MNKDDLYFKLYASCIPVKGAKRSTICDIQRHEIKLIPNSLYTILTEHKSLPFKILKTIYTEIEILNEYFDFLIANEFGFWTSNPERFPDLDLTWKYPGKISNAIIDTNAQSQHDYKTIFQQLEDLSCKFVQLRFFSTISLQELDNILHHVLDSSIQSIELIAKYQNEFTSERILQLCEKHSRVHQFIVHSAPVSKQEHLKTEGIEATFMTLSFVNSEVTSASHCGIVDPYYFSINIKSFTEAKHFNSCLNGKISIDVNGFIKNCPSLNEQYGNIKDTSLSEALAHQKFKALWEINKDQINTCKDCEFRYVCSDCRAFIVDKNDKYSKPSTCKYDPYSASWAE